jgi:hypothetical protein
MISPETWQGPLYNMDPANIHEISGLARFFPRYVGICGGREADVSPHSTALTSLRLS